MIEILYYLFGRFFYFIGFKKLGHEMVCMSVAGDFGLCKKVRLWIIENCPDRECAICKKWTCPKY